MSPIEQELREAEEAIKHCRQRVDRHRAEVEKRERVGHDASQARSLLSTFQRLQAEHEAHRDRVLAELSQSSQLSP